MPAHGMLATGRDHGQRAQSLGTPTPVLEPRHRVPSPRPTSEPLEGPQPQSSHPPVEFHLGAIDPVTGDCRACLPRSLLPAEVGSPGETGCKLACLSSFRNFAWPTRLGTSPGLPHPRRGLSSHKPSHRYPVEQGSCPKGTRDLPPSRGFHRAVVPAWTGGRPASARAFC